LPPSLIELDRSPRYEGVAFMMHTSRRPVKGPITPTPPVTPPAAEPPVPEWEVKAGRLIDRWIEALLASRPANEQRLSAKEA
jgi:hypothetical protein